MRGTQVASARFCVGVADTAGRREEMEDAWAVCGRFGGDAERDLFLLLDGHCGRAAARLGVARLPALVGAQLAAGAAPPVALRAAFRAAHEAIVAEEPQCGTTATALLFLGDDGWCAHVGDSRVAAVAPDGTVRRVTVDHRPTNPAEAAAVRARGGFVFRVGGGALRVNGVIAVTRALGDKALADALSCEPDIARLAPPPAASIVLASDGFWDSVSFVFGLFPCAHILHVSLIITTAPLLLKHRDEDLVRVVLNEELDCRQAAEELRDLAYKNGSFDNITVMIIRAP